MTPLDDIKPRIDKALDAILAPSPGWPSTLLQAMRYSALAPGKRTRPALVLLAAEAVRGFGITPKAALLSHSSFGTANTVTAQKMRAALALIERIAPDLEVEGEMHGDAADRKSTRLNSSHT